MEIKTKADIRLLGRAVREDWPTPPETKQQAIDALLEIISLKDPELSIEAVKVLIKADEANTKRRLVELRENEINEQHRLRLLELAKSLPAPELARLASVSGIVIESSQEG